MSHILNLHDTIIVHGSQKNMNIFLFGKNKGEGDLFSRDVIHKFGLLFLISFFVNQNNSQGKFQ